MDVVFERPRTGLQRPSYSSSQFVKLYHRIKNGLDA